MVKRIGSHNMDVFYPNLCHNKAGYKGTVLYLGITIFKICIWGGISSDNWSEN